MVDRKQPGRPEVRLDPKVQAQLLEQMREEQAAAIRSRRIKLFGVFPATLAITVWSAMAALSDDQTEAIIGNIVASSMVFLLWKLRKRLATTFGFS